MSLTVLSVAYPLAPVGCDTPGGAEQVLALLDRFLVQRGYRSLVIAQEGSTVAGELIPIPPAASGEIGASEWVAAHWATRRALHKTLTSTPVDIVHMHGVDFYRYLPDPGVPVLATLHLPPEWYPETVFSPDRPETFLQCVSASQHRRCPPSPCLVQPIENGIDVGAFLPADAKGDYVLALGRICPEKGFHLALEAAERAGVPMVLAGPAFPYPEHRAYFEEQIRPKIQGNRRWVGAVGLERKRQLLSEARCLLITSLAPETSSLVAMEAAASGTPVIAFPSGALSDIVQHEETGFLVNNTEEMAAAIGRIDEIAPTRCREHAEKHFSISYTVDRYLETYSRVAAPHARGLTSVEVVRTAEGLEALESEWTRLFNRCTDAPPFLHPGWQLSWWRTFGSAKLHTIAVHRGGGLVALAPMFVFEGRLVFIGNGISDCLDVLAPSPGERQILLTAIRSSGYGFDFQELPQDSPLLEFGASPSSVCPTVDLTRPLPAKMRKNLRLQERYLRERASVSIDQLTAAEAVESLIRLHGLRWESRGRAGVLWDPQVVTFHRRAASELQHAGMLRSFALRADGREIAAYYGFERGNQASYYLGGFDPEFERFSPGALLIAHAMEAARRSGRVSFDFLRGAEPYKYRWGAADRVQFSVRS